MKLPSTSNSGDNQSVLAEINITPMVDVMLVLLIIFMVTAPLLQQGIDIDLPEVNAASVNATDQDFILAIKSNGQIYLGSEDKMSYSIDTVEEKLKAIFENKEKKELYVKADKGVLYGFVVQVMAACQRAGVNRVGMITLPENESR